MGGAVPRSAAGRLHPPPFKPCVRLSRTRLTGGLLVQHARLRVANRTAHPVQALLPKPLPRPDCGATRLEVPAVAPHHEAVETPPDVTVELVELPGSVPGAEVVAPAA